MKRDLEQLRMKIAALDKEILQLSKKRMLIAEEVGKIKSSSNIPVVNYVSEASVFKRAEAVARDKLLTQILLANLFPLLLRNLFEYRLDHRRIEPNTSTQCLKKRKA